MQIICPNCSKKFEIKDNLIPSNGRLLQCGSCEHQWFYKKKQIHLDDLKQPDYKKKKIYEKIIPEAKSNKIKIDVKKDFKILPDDEDDKVSNYEKISFKKVNHFKIFIVFIITFIAFIIIIDTFKIYISNFFPSIDNILNNLYESLRDIVLFFKDLFN